MKGFKEGKNDYALNMGTIERWQDDAGMKNRKLIKSWADDKRELAEAEESLKARKTAVALSLQEAKDQGAKVTDKMITAYIDADEEVIELRRERNLLQIDIEEKYQMMLLYRDMWNASVTIRNSVTNQEKNDV